LSSRDAAEGIEPSSLPYPTYWFRSPPRIPTEAGHHRIAWDLRYPPPPGTRREFSIAAIYKNTPSGPVGPFVHPGRYAVRLAVDGAVMERPLDVRMDPRVAIGPDDLQQQTELSLACYRGYLRAQGLRDAIDKAVQGSAGASAPLKKAAWEKLRGSGMPGDPDILYGSIAAEPDATETVAGLQEKLLYMLNLLQAADARPTAQARDAVAALQKTLIALEARWTALR
jgi:hypothetical protein